MKYAQLISNPPRTVLARLSAALGLLFMITLTLATNASASFEQVTTFPGVTDGPLIHSLAETESLAVNAAGAGGAPAGALYAAGNAEIGGENSSRVVVRYSAKGEFLGYWSTHSRLALKGLAVNQVTGNVYVGSSLSEYGSTGIIQVYNADGSQLITSFGEAKLTNGETIDEGPERLHVLFPSGIAIDDSGVLYVSDRDLGGSSRVMVFKPQSPGDYEHYVYAGRANDIAVSHGSVNYNPQLLALDATGNLYVANAEALYEFDPSDPGAAAICEYQLPPGFIEGMTVDPASGEVFFYNRKDKKFHQLAPCNAQGEFVEKASFVQTPKEGSIRALAFNPALAWEPSRPIGVLYAVPSSPLEDFPHGLGYIFAPAVVRDPVVESESVTSVTSSTATLRAQINPKGSPTRYTFQYITEAAYQENEPGERFAGAVEAPLGGAALGSGQASLAGGVSLVGLAPDTGYHYRVIATSHCDPDDEAKLCEAVGPGQAFHTFPALPPGLPDDRAWELVSPVQKQGGEAFPANPREGSCFDCKPAWLLAPFYPMQSSPDGEAVVYEGFPFSSTEGAAQFNQYISRRTVSGWQTTILTPALLSGKTAEGYKGFDPGLNRGVIVQGDPTLSPEAPAGYANLYTQPTSNPFALTPLIKALPPNRNPTLTYAGASADLSRIFFEADDALSGETPFAPEALDGGKGKNNLYEWRDGELSLVNVHPGNAGTTPGAAFGSGRLLISNQSVAHSDFSHVISADGSHVFWSSEGGGLYVRIDGEETIEIPSPGLCKASLPIEQRVCFLTASNDGSEVLLSNGQLYDLQAEATVDLTEGKGRFQGIIGQSDDLSHVYFVDTAVLSEEENDQGAKAQAGENNLYAWHEGAVAFVATLAPEDQNTVSSGGGDWDASPPRRTAEASPDGRWVTFLSSAPLTGYEPGSCTFFNQGNLVSSLCNEVFLYDSASGELSCPSCNPTGMGPPGESYPLRNSLLPVILLAASSFPQPRYLTNEGRLYFDSQDSLTPFDTNNGVEDVYQFEPQGVGSCKREAGCVSLISGGHEPVDSNFLAADETGKNVFFTTRDQLVIKDRDDLIDVYVAREGGGIPAETETARSECQGESCQPAAVVPNDPTPGSSSFEGAGNVVEKKAAKKKAKAHRKKRKHRAKRRHRKRAYERAASHSRGGAR